MSDISCELVNRSAEGSCNACNSQDFDGERVIMVRLTTLNFRLCPPCARKLRAYTLECLVQFADQKRGVKK